MEKIDIKALARELKQTASGEKAKPVAQVARKPEPVKRIGSPKKELKSDLNSIIDAVNKRNDFVLNFDVCIDADIHDILRQIKSQTKLVIGNLASALLEEFILEHKSEIMKLIIKKPNRLI